MSKLLVISWIIPHNMSNYVARIVHSWIINLYVSVIHNSGKSDDDRSCCLGLHMELWIQYTKACGVAIIFDNARRMKLRNFKLLALPDFL